MKYPIYLLVFLSFIPCTNSTTQDLVNLEDPTTETPVNTARIPCDLSNITENKIITIVNVLDLKGKRVVLPKVTMEFSI